MSFTFCLFVGINTGASAFSLLLSFVEWFPGMKACKDFSLGSSFDFEDVFGSGSAPCIMYLVHLDLILDHPNTSMHWIQSHVQDEHKRKSTGSKVMCACRKASGHTKECTVPGSEHHWMHEGNDEADRLAKQSKGMDAVHGMAELLKGEEAYVLGNRGGVAQGGYREWIIENLTNKYMRESKSIGINKIKEAKGNAQLTLWASMNDHDEGPQLDSAKGITWRLWSRMLTETLPTNHKLSRMAESNNDNNQSIKYLLINPRGKYIG